jgi:glycosyltransferase involved in cell wall biosynthesis
MIREKNKFPPVTFIIPTLDAITHLPRLIGSIRSQNYPRNCIEIIVSDGGSKDGTVAYCRKQHIRVIYNPLVLHEPGKTLAAKSAHGKIIFYTDADNYLASDDWIGKMIRPFLDHPDVVGFLPQTRPPPDSSSLNRYLGYLYTDPFSWFVYQNGANPLDYKKIFRPVAEKPSEYIIYKFSISNLPLFGLSQGTGVVRRFKRSADSSADDILAGIAVINHGGLIAHIPDASLYHYHVDGISRFISKYTWRVRNNLVQKIKLMGFVHRKNLLSPAQIARSYLFIPYAITVILPLYDSIRLSLKYRDSVMLWHLPATLILSLIMVKELTQKYLLNLNLKLGQYE